MSPKVSKTKAKVTGVVKKNKQNILNETNESKPVIRKKKKGEIKHEKKLMKKKAKALEQYGEIESVESEAVDSRHKSIQKPNRNNGDSLTSNADEIENNLTDLDLSSNISSAFVQSIIEKSKLKVEKEKGDGSRHKKLNFTQEELEDDYLDGFTNVKKGKSVKPEINKTSEGYGAEGYRLIIEGKNHKATEYLTRAIGLDHFDIRHYLNRSYAQMCTGDYNEALFDIQFAMVHNSNPIDLARMKCRQGQIFSRMQRYEKAEECFRDCLNLFPDSITIKCEFMKMKINQLVNMGFPETAVIAVLYDYPHITLQRAVKFLEEIQRDYQSYDSDISDSDDDVYQSDTEEDISNTTLFMEMVDFNVRRKDELWFTETAEHSLVSAIPELRVINATAAQSSTSIQAPTAPVKELRIINAAAVKKTPKPQGTNVNNRAVWVGSLTQSITESMLKRAFSVFGPVHSVYRSDGAACAFINFEHEASAAIALEAECLDVNGRSLPIRLNKRNR